MVAVIVTDHCCAFAVIVPPCKTWESGSCRGTAYFW